MQFDKCNWTGYETTYMSYMLIQIEIRYLHIQLFDLN